MRTASHHRLSPRGALEELQRIVRQIVHPNREVVLVSKPLSTIGRKLIRYDAAGVTLFTQYYVCDVPFCFFALFQDFCAVFSHDSMNTTP